MRTTKLLKQKKTKTRGNVCVWESKRKKSDRELEQRRHAGEHLQDERLPVEDVELPAAELNALPQQRVALVVSVDLKQHTTRSVNNNNSCSYQ